MFRRSKLHSLPHIRHRQKMSLKEILDIIRAVLTIAAILAAGWWFVKQGFAKPEIKLEHTVTQRRSADDKGAWLIGIEVRVTNVGKVPVDLKDGMLIVSQVNPVRQAGTEELDRESLDKKLYLDPGEADQATFETLLLPDGYKTILVQSVYPVPRTLLGFQSILGFRIPGKPDREWTTETLFDIGPSSEPVPHSP